MTGHGLSGTSPLEVLEPQECWRLLSTHRVGRIAFTDRALPAIRPLNYTLVGQRVMLRLVGEELGRRLHEQVVAFEVDDVDIAGHVGWSVVIVGTVELRSSPGAVLRTASLPPSWAGEGHQTAACLTVGDISGRRLHALLDLRAPA